MIDLKIALFNGKELAPELEQAVTSILLVKVPKSLTIGVRSEQVTTIKEMPDLYSGMFKLKNGKTWEERQAFWLRNKPHDLAWATIENRKIVLHDKVKPNTEATNWVPLFSSYFKEADWNTLKSLLKSNPPQTNDGNSKMKELFAKMLDANKDATKLAAKLSVGKAANQVITSKLTKSLPWYAKLFGGKKDLASNPLTKIATAQVVNAAVMHFAPGNAKLEYVANAMLQEAMVDVATNSEVLKGLISELEGLAGSNSLETTNQDK